MKKIIIVLMVAMVLVILLACQKDIKKTKKGGKGVVWGQGEGGRIVMLLVEGSKATTLEDFEIGSKDPVKVGDVYEIISGSDPSHGGDQTEEIKFIAAAEDNQDFYSLDINLGEEIKEEYPDIYLLDVRTEEEYRQGHLQDALLVPVDRLREGAAQALPDRQRPVLVYCRSGKRSAQAATILKDLGYHLVLDIGGINRYNGTLIK